MGGHSFRTYLRMGLATLRYEGPLVLALRAIRLACSPLGTLSVSTFCRKDLANPVVAPQPRAAVEIHRLEAADAALLAPVLLHANRTAPRPDMNLDIVAAEEIVRTRLQRGAICFVATAGTEIVHYNWLVPGMRWSITSYLEFVPTESTEVLLHDAFTAEDWRGHGLHGAVHARLLQFAQAAGYRASYTSVATDNRSSRKALKRLDYAFYSTGIVFRPRWGHKTMMLRLGVPVERFRAR